MDGDLAHLSDINSPTTLPNLPDVLSKGLAAVSVLAPVSLVSSSTLSVYLGYRLLAWKQCNQARTNQFLVLIFNLLLADVQQSLAFVINAYWTRKDSIIVGTPVCWTQGWFVSTGDLSSGLFTFAIAVHSLSDIVFDYRLSHRMFILTILGLWTFNYMCAIIGLAMHPSDLYVRAGAWCWINKKYIEERLWLHYFWIIAAEFGTLVIYAFIFIILRRRVRESLYATSAVQLRASSAAKLIFAYPIIYVVCTLPLVVARLKSMAGAHVDFTELCVAAALITSNGWPDVLLYSITRHGPLFGPDIPDESARVLNTFTSSSNWRPDRMFGTTTIIEATIVRQSLRARFGEIRGTGNDDTEQLCDPRHLNVKTETTIRVSIEIVKLDALGAHHISTICESMTGGGNADCIKGRLSFDTEETDDKR